MTKAKRAGVLAQVVEPCLASTKPSFKLQYLKKKKKEESFRVVGMAHTTYSVRASTTYSGRASI
jgi:hypothetical protein